MKKKQNTKKAKTGGEPVKVQIGPKATERQNSQGKMWRLAAVALLFSTVLMAAALVVTLMGPRRPLETAEAAASISNLSQLKIYLNEETTIEEINTHAKTLKYEDNTATLTTAAGTLEFSDVQMKGRGNSTWSWAKKPYRMKLDARTDLLGLGKARKWVLRADYIDVTHLRNDTALKLAQMLNEKYAIRGDYVEMTVDDNYYGLYYLSHGVYVGKEEVDLREPLGIIMEIDDLHKDGEGYISYDGNYLTVKDVVNEDQTAAAVAEFIAAYNQMERAAKRGDWQTVARLIDTESFAEYYLVSEFTVNPDAYSSSFFLYKDGTEDKIHAGPVWDYDFALANREWTTQHTEELFSPNSWQLLRRYADGETVYNESLGATVTYPADPNISKIIFYLLDIPEFYDVVVDKWQQSMAGKKEELLNHMKAQAEKIHTAVLKDAERWKRSGADEETEKLLEWVSARYDFMENMLKYEPEKLPKNLDSNFSQNLALAE